MFAKAACCSTAPKACGLTYNGSARNLVSGGSSSCGTMQYCATQSGTYSTTIPTQTNAGTYTTYWKVSNDSNHSGTCSGSVSTTIAKKAVVCTAPTAKSLTYTSSAQTLANAGSCEGGTIQYCSTSGGTYSGTIPTGTNAGSYTVWYKCTASNNNYSGTCSGSTSCSIAKAAGSATVNMIYAVYDGSAKPLATVSNNTGTMHYKVGDSGSWITSIPTATDVLTYTVYWYMDASTNYEGIASATTRYVTSYILCASQSAPTATGATTTYPTTATATASGGGGGGGSIEWSNGNTQTSVGSKTTKAKWTATRNYCSSNWSNEVTVKMNKYTPTVTLSATNRAYNGSALYATASVATPSGGVAMKGTIYYGTSAGATTYSVTYNGATTYSVNLGSVSVTNVGSATVYAYFVPDSSCNSYYNNSGNASKTFSVSKANQSAPTATGATVTYHNTATATASGGGGQGTLTWTNGSTRTATGSQDTYAYWAGNSNYNASPNSNKVTLTVNKATDQSITVTLNNITYNGTSLCVASATKHGMKNFQLGFGSSSTSAPTSWTTDNYLYATNVGTYYIWYKGTVDENHSADISATYKGTATISCSGTTISTKPTAKALTYNGSAQALVNAGTAPSNTTMYYNLNGGTWGTSIPSGTNAGTYTVGYQARGNNSNYCNSASGTVSVTIAKRAMTSCTPTAKSVVYNGSAQVIVNDCAPTGGDIQYSGGGNSSYSTTVPTRTDVGTYIINWKNVPDGNHSGGTTGQITTAKITCKACTAPTAKSLTYTGSAQALVNAGSTSYGTMVYSTSQNGTYSTSIPTGTNAGSYTVWWKVTGNTNVCCTSPASVAVTIAKANPVLSFSTSVIPSIIKQFYTHSAPVTVTSGDGTVSYSSSSTGYVTVNSSGTITGVKARFDSNEVKITATISEGTNFKSGSTSYWVEPVSCELALRPTSSTGTRFAFTRGNSIEYKIGTGGTWTTLASGSYTSTVSNGQRIFWRGSLSKVSGDGVGTFVASGGTYVAEGNAMSILFGSTYYYQFSLAGKDNAAFDSLFGSENQLLTSAADLQLPATTLSKWCYYGMFLNCRKLMHGPCLPAPTLTEGCYYSMFQGCTELNRISCLATNISANVCTYAWVNGVYSSGSGIFTKASSMSSWTTGDSGIPSGWSTANGTSCY